MTTEMLRTWLEAYGRAWETRNAEAVTALFSDDATYQETPFVEPLRGLQAIAAYWSAATGSHVDVHFDYAVLALSGNQGIAHWRCSFVRPQEKASLRLDGVFVLQFDEQGQCKSLREWWHRQERGPRAS